MGGQSSFSEPPSARLGLHLIARGSMSCSIGRVCVLWVGHLGPPPDRPTNPVTRAFSSFSIALESLPWGEAPKLCTDFVRSECAVMPRPISGATCQVASCGERDSPALLSSLQGRPPRFDLHRSGPRGPDRSTPGRGSRGLAATRRFARSAATRQADHRAVVGVTWTPPSIDLEYEAACKVEFDVEASYRSQGQAFRASLTYLLATSPVASFGNPAASRSFCAISSISPASGPGAKTAGCSGRS